LEGAERHDHQAEFPASEVEAAHVAAFESQRLLKTSGRCLLRRDREHVRRQVEAGDADLRLASWIAPASAASACFLCRHILCHKTPFPIQFQDLAV